MDVIPQAQGMDVIPKAQGMDVIPEAAPVVQRADNAMWRIKCPIYVMLMYCLYRWQSINVWSVIPVTNFNRAIGFILHFS